MNQDSPALPAEAAERDDVALFEWSDLRQRLLPHWKSVAVSVLAGAICGGGASFAFQPVYRSATTFIPPQQSQGAAAAMASLGPLAALAGAGVKTPADQFAAFLASDTVRDRMIDRFHLLQVYDVKFRDAARMELKKHTLIDIGKKDGLITVEVSEHDAKRAADMANAYVTELRELTSHLAITEAQRRRVFFERQMKEAAARLDEAQRDLQQSGLSSGALKTEPKSAAEGYARLAQELSTQEVKLNAMRAWLAENAPEMMQLKSTIAALNDQLARAERDHGKVDVGPGYITRYRSFKYQETVYELMSKQFELARLDEAREGDSLQVIDVAQPAEHRMFPRRSYFAAGGALLLPVFWLIFLLQRSGRKPAAAS